MKAHFTIHLDVNTVTANSGIYFGNHIVVTGHSHHSKTNAGFGSIASNNHVSGNLSFVYDPDVIDTPIDDRDVHLFAPDYRHAASNVLQAKLDAINVETIQQNAGVFIGDTTVTGFDSHEKDNIGLGPFYGSQNMTTRNTVVTYDPDGVDAIMDDRDIKSGVFITPNGPVNVNGR